MKGTIKLNNYFYSSIALFLVFGLPILRYYDLPGTGIDLGALLTILLLLCSIVATSLPNSSGFFSARLYKSKRCFLVFAAWAIIVTLLYEILTKYNISNANSEYTVFSFLQAIQIICIISLFLSGNIDGQSAVRIYSVFVRVLLIIFGIQWILQIIGIQYSFQLPFHNFSDSWSALKQQTFGMQWGPTSLFSEPAHFCQYMLPYLAIVLFDDFQPKKRRFIISVIISVAIISTVSGNGIVCVALLWGYYFTFSENQLNAKRLFVFLGGILLFVCAFFILQKIDTINVMFSHLFRDTSGNQYYFSKADYRIYRGFDIYGKLPFLQKIFGVGYRHMHMFAVFNGIVSQYDSSFGNYEYFSTITQVLIYFGIVGFIPFVMHLYHFYKSNIKVVKALVILFVALCFSSTILFDSTHIVYAALMVALLQREISANEKVIQ